MIIAKVLDIKVNTYTMSQALNTIIDRVKLKQQTFVVTANAEIIMMAQKDKEFKEILNNVADIILADGAGVVLAAKLLNYPLTERVAGCDLTYNLIPLLADHNMSVYFFGANEGVALAAANKALSIAPHLKIAGTRNGFFTKEQEDAIIEQINKTNADIIFFALGVPKQEKFINKYRSLLNAKLLMGVGGTFDVMAGNVKRAPIFMQKYHLEWLYRLYLQPQRLSRMSVLPIFVLKVLLSKILDKKWYI